MQLALSRACTDRAPRNQVRYELRRDSVEKLDANGDAHVREVAEELARRPEALVDLERAVDVGIVDEAFPADRCSWFLQMRREA